MEQNLRLNIFFDKIKKFYYSFYYFSALVITALLSYIFRLESIGIAIMILFTCVNLISNRDMLPSLMPIMLCGIFTMVHRAQSDYYWLFVMAIPLIPSFIFHLIYYPIDFKLRNSRMFFPMLAVAVAITSGGLFSIGVKEYFAMPALFYVIGLGFGMLIVYIFAEILINLDEKYNIKKYLPNMMTAIGIMMFLMLTSYYLMNIRLLIDDYDAFFRGLYWGNNLSTSLLLTMPFTFYMVVKGEHSIIYFLLGIMQYLCLLLSLSRGGMLFGTIMFPICVLATLIKVKTDRKKLLIITGILILLGLVLLIIKWDFFITKIKDLLTIQSDEARFDLYKEAIKNFLNNPIFGAGLGFIGKFYYPGNGSMYWYHSTPFQIIGSLGIIGCIAYTYQFIARMNIFKAKKDDFNFYMFLSFLGFELYALVNVGDFFPFPFVVILTEYFVILNKMNKTAN